MSAYYNEIDPFAADWLRKLIRHGHIAPGEVDTRSIEDVAPADLAGFTQCHFFAGVGAWSYALRLADWPDDRPVWTGSCPCPPFSSAGKKKRCPKCGSRNPLPHAYRTGVFRCTACGHDWNADGRHLWPEFYRLIKEFRPCVVFGEQVASRDGDAWGDIVQSTLELEGYTVGRVPFASCGVGAPQWRLRLYWMADAERDEQWLRGRSGCQSEKRDEPRVEPCGRRPFVGMADACGIGCNKGRGGDNALHDRNEFDSSEQNGGLAHSQRGGPENGQLDRAGLAGCRGIRGIGANDCTKASQRCASGSMEHPISAGLERHTGHVFNRDESRRDNAYKVGPTPPPGVDSSPGPVNGYWRDVDWLSCTDGYWRPVEPGTFPLAHGATNRVGRLRGYGNAINPHQAKEFIRAYMESRYAAV